MGKTSRIPANWERSDRYTNMQITSDKAFVIQKNESGEGSGGGCTRRVILARKAQEGPPCLSSDLQELRE